MITQNLTQVIAAVPIPALVVGGDDRIAVCNKAATRLLGGRVDGLNHISVLRQPAILDAIAAAVEFRQPQSADYIGREGARDVRYRVTLTPMDAGVVAVFEDRSAVTEISQFRRDFIANVSHELRTPLTSLLGFIETLQGPARDDAAARTRFLGIMAQEADRMRQLVDDLLSLSRVEDEERVRPKTTVDLAGLVVSVIDRLAPLASASQIKLVPDIGQGSYLVPGDEAQLRQVLTNLLENAIKYGAGTHDITVALSGPAHEPLLQAQGIQLTVQDHGEGIAHHHIARLTERFYRVDTHRSREVGGTGLGLAIVKHIVNRHRGRFRLQSELGEGTCVTVILPITTDDVS